jgi:hypothetical protein
MAIQISVSVEDLPRVLEMIKEASEDMDITVTVNDRQQQRAADPHVTARAAETTGAPASSGMPEIAPRIGREAMQKLTRLASLPDRRLLVSFIEQQMAEHGAVVDPGPEDLKYVRLHLPSHRGAYCYPTARGFIDFRLRPEDQEGCQFAFVRGGANHGAPYCVRLRLDSDAAVEEALKLARTAARRVAARTDQGTAR